MNFSRDAYHASGRSNLVSNTITEYCRMACANTDPSPSPVQVVSELSEAPFSDGNERDKLLKALGSIV